MTVFINGKFLPEDQSYISIFERGFLYGDGLFETIRISNGKPFRWEQHLERLGAGLDCLGLHLPCSPEQLKRWATELIRQNEPREALLRLTISRGEGPRGYSPRGADHPTWAMSLHAVPGVDAEVQRYWGVITSSIRLN